MAGRHICWAKVFQRTLKNSLHTEQSTSVYGKQINYVQAGKGDETLLLMPGALGSAWTDFRYQIEELPKLLPNHTLIAWDPPGCGRSQRFGRSSSLNLFEADAFCAIDLMQAIHRNNFSVLGWNTGGTTALMVAGRFPQFVDKLVIWGSSAYLSVTEMRKLDEIRGVKSMERQPDLGKALKIAYGEQRFSQMWEEYKEALEKIIYEKNGNLCKTEVDCIQAPTLILHGLKDPVIPLDHIQFLLRHIKNSRYHEFPYGKHDIHINEAPEFNKRVSKFLLEQS